MSIASISLYRYCLPLVRPLPLKEQVITERGGFILALTDDYGDTSYGEIAPLPGFSVETLEDTQAQAVALLERCPRGTNLEDLPEMQGDTAAWHALAPSLRCGLSMALQDYWAREEGAKLYQYLCAFPRKRVAIAGLLTGDADALAARAETLREREYIAAKIKVGAVSVEEDIERVRTVAGILGAGVQLRLDANGAWDFDTACRFAEGVRDCSIAYLEEPLTDFARLPELKGATGLPFAMDETIAPMLGVYFDAVHGRLDETALDPLGGTDAVRNLLREMKAIVVKPALVGECGRLAMISQAFADFELCWVMSSAFESGVGIAAHAQLAGALEEDDVAAGLDTYAWLAEDVLVERLPLGEARASLDAINRLGGAVDTERLELVWAS